MLAECRRNYFIYQNEYHRLTVILIIEISVISRKKACKDEKNSIKLYLIQQSLQFNSLEPFVFA